jgi:hypothetical protein
VTLSQNGPRRNVLDYSISKTASASTEIEAKMAGQDRHCGDTEVESLTDFLTAAGLKCLNDLQG